MWRETQEQFAAALRDPRAPVPTAISGAGDMRFNVYRNNVAVSLSDAITETYPVVLALVGEDYFRELARNFTRLFLPSTPVLLNYGEDFADFIATQSSADAVPGLDDVARLEWACNRSYHATDATPISIEALAAEPDDTVENIRFDFHPSLGLLKSDWPIVSIWTAHQAPDTEDRLANLPGGSERALIVRPEGDVNIHALEPAVFEFILALREGQTLGQASSHLLDEGISDLSTPIADLFAIGAVVGLSHST